MCNAHKSLYPSFPAFYDQDFNTQRNMTPEMEKTLVHCSRDIKRLHEPNYHTWLANLGIQLKLGPTSIGLYHLEPSDFASQIEMINM